MAAETYAATKDNAMVPKSAQGSRRIASIEFARVTKREDVTKQQLNDNAHTH